MTTFVDRVVLHASAGDGGHGCSSILREKFKPLGGPDGGDGGNGGDVVLEVDPDVNTLVDLHFHPHRKAVSGKPGQGSNRSGATGPDVVVPVPSGTVVHGPNGAVLADLVGAGSRYVVARGGQGGRGNAHLAGPRRRAPGFALLGEPGQTADVELELKTVADVALVGFPSAGKSSLISVISAAKPKVADYPFTTLSPNLGVVVVDQQVITVADVPGLIPGASQGKGLGLDFLRHIERCSVLVHVLDCGTLDPGRDPVTDLDVLEAELAAYAELTGADLAGRPRLVVLNKVDLPEARELAELVTPIITERGLPVFALSAVSRVGLTPFLRALVEQVETARVAVPEQEPSRIVLRPRQLGAEQFAVVAEDGGYTVTGDKPVRWIRQTDFSNEEAVGFLADRLAKLGVENALAKAGAQAGAEVTIGGITFDWEPTTGAGAAAAETMGPRGTDLRLQTGRATRAERESYRRSYDDELLDPSTGHAAEKEWSGDDEALPSASADDPPAATEPAPAASLR